MCIIIGTLSFTESRHHFFWLHPRNKSYYCVKRTQSLQSWTNFFGRLAFISVVVSRGDSSINYVSVQCTFLGLQMPIPSPLHNVRYELVHFQPHALFSLHFPQATLNGGRGLQKNPEYVIKSELKDETLLS